MKQISRHEAEALVYSSQVISSDVEQDHEEMRIYFTLDDRSVFILKYDLQNHKKRYFIKEII